VQSNICHQYYTHCDTNRSYQPVCCLNGKFLTKYNAMKMHACLSLALGGGEPSASLPGPFLPQVPIEKDAQVGPRVNSNAVVKNKSLLGITPWSSGPQHSHYTD
jgi:hypothetical protein